MIGIVVEVLERRSGGWSGGRIEFKVERYLSALSCGIEQVLVMVHQLRPSEWNEVEGGWTL